MYKYKPTDRETAILALAAGGLRNWQIAQKLSLSEQTIKNELSALYRKIGARDKAHAVAIAIRSNLIA